MYRRIQTEADQTHTLYTCLNMYLVRNDTNSASLASWIYSILSFTTTGLTVTLRIDSLWALQNKPNTSMNLGSVSTGGEYGILLYLFSG